MEDLKVYTTTGLLDYLTDELRKRKKNKKIIEAIRKELIDRTRAHEHNVRIFSTVLTYLVVPTKEFVKP